MSAEPDLYSGHDRGIIIAADMATLPDLRRLGTLASTVGVAIKVGFALALRHGLQIVVRAIKDVAGLPVIYDQQKAGTDIPKMRDPYALACRESGAYAIILLLRGRS